MNNIQSILNMGSSFLKENHINSYQIDSELLLSKVLNKNREYMFLNHTETFNNELLQKFKVLLNRRKKKEPLAYILNHKEFWKNSFYIDKNVLIPTPYWTSIIFSPGFVKIRFLKFCFTSSL